MGQELRSIVLTDSEFHHAACLFFEADAARQVLAENIDRVEVTEGENATASVKLKIPLVDGKTEIPLDQTEMVEAIVHFCRDRIIPLPRNGRKLVVRRDDHVILEIELDWF